MDFSVLGFSLSFVRSFLILTNFIHSILLLNHVLYNWLTAATAKSLQSCLTLCHPRDSSPPGSPVPGILQARTLEWVAISFSNVWKWKVKGKSLSRVWLLAIPWTAADQAPPSMGFSRQEYWSGVPLPSLLHYLVLVNYTTVFKLCTNDYTTTMYPALGQFLLPENFWLILLS